MTVEKTISLEQGPGDHPAAQGAPPRSGDSQDGGCPPLEQLWPVAVDEIPSNSVVRHLETCRACRERTALLAREIGEARVLLAGRRLSLRSAADANSEPAGGDTFLGDAVCDFARAGAAMSPGGREQASGRTDNCGAATLPKAVIGKYLGVETICRSGQATVYRGLHPSLLIDVVIKLANHPWRRDDTGRARLVAEAKALAEIDHPHLARLYDLDFYDDRPFLVLEYVRGGHLAHYRESAGFTPCQIASLVEKVARAVAAAHERGILHLDLKPENILVTPSGEPVLIDFGLSFLSSSGGVRSSREGRIAGTPQYMSPEQTQGVRESLTQRTDVYGLGGVLYYLCVGKDPFTVSKIDGRLHRPEQPDWQALARANVPARLKSICRKALSANPEARYATAKLMADALTNVGRTRATPVLGHLHKLAGVVFFSGVACLTAAALVPPNPLPRPSSLRLHVNRAGRDLPLTEAIPLRVQDRISLEGFVRESSYTAVLSVNESGAVQWIGPLQLVRDRDGARISYPGFSDSVPVSQNAGPILILLVSHRDRPVRPQDTVRLVPQKLSLSSLPQQAIVFFDRQTCDIRVESGTSLTQQQTETVRREIGFVQHQLAGRFDDFAGIFAVSTGMPQTPGVASRLAGIRGRH